MAALEQIRWFGKMGEIRLTVTPGVIPSADRVLMPRLERFGGLDRGRSQGMDGIREVLEIARDHDLVAGHFLGLLHVAIGRKITRSDGTIISTGSTWRELAGLLKLLRFDRELVREYGADPEALAPRDRERFWYAAIAKAKVDSAAAVVEADRLVPKLKGLGFLVGPSPFAVALPVPLPARTKKYEEPTENVAEDKSPRRKKK